MPGFWRKCRTTLRWLRFAVWAVLLAALILLAWINVIGLPDFFKTRLVAAAHDHGIQLQFSRLRWRLIHGVVAENVLLGDKKNSRPSVLTAGEIQLRFNYHALLHFHFEVNGIVVRNGKLILPVSATNQLSFQNLQAQIRFLPADTWAFDELRGEFSGVQFLIAGEVAHAPEIKKWEIFAGKKNVGGGATTAQANEFSRTLEKIKFARAAQISATLHGDARDPHSFILRLNGNVPDVATPWFAARNLQFAANLTAPPDAPAQFDASLDFWTNALPFRLAWIARSDKLDLRDFATAQIECSGIWSAPKLDLKKFSAQLGGGKINAAAALDIVSRQLDFTNDSAFDVHVLQIFLPEKLRSRLAEISWQQPPSLVAQGLITLPPWTNTEADWRDFIGPTARLHGDLNCTNVTVRGKNFELTRTHFDFANEIWRAPDFQLQQGRTKIEGGGEFSLATENVSGVLRGNLAPETAQIFLPTNLSEKIFHIVNLNEPLALNLNAAGNLKNLDSFSATGNVALTNFAVREQTFDSVAADFSFDNRTLIFSHPQSFRANGSQWMKADAVALDFSTPMLFFTNGFSTMDPMAVVRAIGPKTARIMEPYEFLSPPTARVQGQLPLHDVKNGRDLEGTDMRFEIVEGAPFRWTKLSTTNITGTVHWMGQELELTNVMADFYGGNATGHAFFDFRPPGYGCDFDFGVSVSEVDVHRLAMDLSGSETNHLEGALTGLAVVTHGNSQTWRSWNGYGEARVRDGLLWNIPLFGMFSPALNSVAPGLGNSRATGATMDFAMTNGVAYSQSLEILTRTMRLNYSGTVDLGGNVNARVTAQLLRNVPVVGSIVSLVLMPVSKIFECQVSGKVSAPNVRPIYFPFSKYLLSPMRSLEEILPDRTQY